MWYNVKIIIKHDFAEQLISYQLTTMLNENGSTRFSSKVFTHSFGGFSYYLKNVIIDRYNYNELQRNKLCLM